MAGTRRLNDEIAMSFATALITAAAIAGVFVGTESHGDIWANFWTYLMISLGGIGLVMATAVVATRILDRGDQNVRSGNRRNAWTRRSAGPNSGTVYPPDEEKGQVSHDSHVITVGVPGPRVQSDVDNSLPLIEECLELRLSNGVIYSKRVTPGESRDKAHMTVPPEDIVQEYRRALRENAQGGSPDEEVARQTLQRAVSLQKLLFQAVPESVRRRLADSSAGKVRQLAAVELRLLDSQLEAYPWELIADPAALQASTAGVTVWRSVLSPPKPAYKGWTGNLLLTGTAAPLRIAPSIEDELTWIESELTGCGGLRVYHSPGIPSDLGPLIAQHPPAAFHLVAHETGPGSRSAVGCGLTFANLKVSPGQLASDLGRAGAWLAVFSCCDSAAMLPGVSRPPSYDIAERSGATVIGMAGPIQSYPGGLFATALYRCLASGASAVHAYHEALYHIRNYGPSSTIWSIPVMYARTSNVVPFPVNDEARIRLSFVQVRLHAKTLSRELLELTQATFPNSGEWALRTAIPMLRTDCIRDYLSATTHEGDPADGRRRQRVNQAQHDLDQALSATKTTLARLGADLDEAGRRQILRQLPVHCAWQQRIIQELDELIEEAG